MKKTFKAASFSDLFSVQEFLNKLCLEYSAVNLAGFSVNYINNKLYYTVIAEYSIS